jgi:hypothetical protein
MSSPPPTATEFVALVDELRARGAVRIACGPYSAEFVGPPLTAAEAAREEVLTQSLTRVEREELNDLRLFRQMREELGDG